MKTKQILYSVALAATMVACSQEELTIPASDTQDLSNRPLLGDITLVDGTAETRFATGSGAQPVFADGDKVGAAIIDAWNGGTNSNAESNYNVVEYYSSNSAFTRVSGAWKLNADMPLVEGNYLFYAPYNAAMNSRAPLTIKVPAQQDASTEKAALDQFYRSGAVVRVGYKFLASENGVAQKPSLTLNDVFAYPMVTVKNNFVGYLENKAGTSWTKFTGGDLKVDSIQLQVVDGSNVAQRVVIGGQLDHSLVKAKMKSDGDWSTSPMLNYTTDILSATDAKRLHNTASNDATYPSAEDRTPGNITTLVAGRTIAAGAEEKFYCVMPALSVDGITNRLMARIYVTINNKQYVMSTATLSFNVSNTFVGTTGVEQGTAFASAVNAINLIKGQKYPQEELNFENGALSAKSSAGNILTIDLVGGLTNPLTGKAQIAKEVTADAAATVIENNEQFINYFKDQLNGSALTEGASTSGTTFKFSDETTAQINSELIDALSKYNNKGSISINTALVVANDVKATIGTTSSPYTNVTFKSKNNVEYVVKLKTVGGGYTVTNGVLMSGNNVSVHVTTGATLRVTGDRTIGNLRNDGTINVLSGSLIPTSFVNNETLNITTKVNNTITNNGTININASTASATVSAGTGTINVAYADRAANVNVIGGTQTGVCIGTFNAANVKEADKITWINAYQADNSGITVAAFNQSVLDEMKDIKTVYATGATFPAGVFDMDAKTLVISGSSAGISGAGIATTSVSNIVIKNNVASANVQLSEIAASGIYSKLNRNAKKILADGISATWNGGKAE